MGLMLFFDLCGSTTCTACSKALTLHKQLTICDLKLLYICCSDSTSEYISGEEVKLSVGDIYHSGLQCVTVLIGVFDRISGQPILGVINQPFHTQHGSR